MDSPLTKFNLKVQFVFCVIVVGLNYTYGYPQVQEKINSSKQVRIRFHIKIFTAGVLRLHKFLLQNLLCL